MTSLPEDAFWPTSPGSKDARLYKDYKRLINTISEKLRRTEVLSLVYQHDLPMWFSEVGVVHEPGFALRVLSVMEGRKLISPANLDTLSQSLELIGRVDLKEKVQIFESKSAARYA